MWPPLWPGCGVMQGMSLGAYDYVLKPVDFAELLDKARKASERKKLNEARSQV